MPGKCRLALLCCLILTFLLLAPASAAEEPLPDQPAPTSLDGTGTFLSSTDLREVCLSLYSVSDYSDFLVFQTPAPYTPARSGSGVAYIVLFDRSSVVFTSNNSCTISPAAVYTVYYFGATDSDLRGFSVYPTTDSYDVYCSGSLSIGAGSSVLNFTRTTGSNGAPATACSEYVPFGTCILDYQSRAVLSRLPSFGTGSASRRYIRPLSFVSLSGSSELDFSEVISHVDTVSFTLSVSCLLALLTRMRRSLYGRVR